MPGEFTLSRRTLLSAAAAPGVLLAAQSTGETGPVSLPPFKSPTERQSGKPPAPMPPDKRLGIAVIGLGNLTVEQILPALQRSQKTRLAALVSGTPDKAKKLAAQYGIAERNIYDYKNFDRIRDDASIQAVYIVLPNGMHREYTVRAAQAGKHVLCEKPMANTPQECEEMIAACSKAGRKLMIGYRIQYEPHNRMIRDLVRNKTHGPVKLIEAVNVQRQGDPNQWRHKRALAGGGALPDIGLYCLNTTRFLLGEEPTEVFAMIQSDTSDPRFKEVEENVIWQMRFPSGVLSTNTTGYDVHESRRYRVYGTTGWFGLEPAFSYSGLRARVSHAEGKIERNEEPVMEEKNQFQLEMDHFSDCVMNDKKPFTPGEEGLQDHRIMAAIYQSANTGKPVRLQPQSKRDAFRGTEPQSE